MEPGFGREDIRARYDVPTIQEDKWHSLTGQKAAEFVARWIACTGSKSRQVLNAGAGVYQLGLLGWEEFPLDIFTTPLGLRPLRTCASVEALPFKKACFGAVICIGEVLAYCDPARAITEFSRVLDEGGLLVLDFGSSRSPRYLLKPSYGRAADLVDDDYNGSVEPTWVYDPNYIKSIIVDAGLNIIAEQGIHAWSAILRRIGFNPLAANKIGNNLDRVKIIKKWGDLILIAAVRRPFA